MYFYIIDAWTLHLLGLPNPARVLSYNRARAGKTKIQTQAQKYHIGAMCARQCDECALIIHFFPKSSTHSYQKLFFSFYRRFTTFEHLSTQIGRVFVIIQSEITGVIGTEE